MQLQQMQGRVDRLDQPELGHEAVHREQSTERRRLNVAADLVTDLPRRQHRLRADTPVPRLPMPSLDLAPAARRIPATLRMRYRLHHKGLSCWAALGSQTQPG
jgi:hypothetical protein